MAEAGQKEGCRGSPAFSASRREPATRIMVILVCGIEDMGDVGNLAGRPGSCSAREFYLSHPLLEVRSSLHFCIGSSLLYSSCTAFSTDQRWFFEHPRDQRDTRQRGRFPPVLFGGCLHRGCRHGHPFVLPRLGYTLKLQYFYYRDLLRIFSAVRAHTSVINFRRDSIFHRHLPTTSR